MKCEIINEYEKKKMFKREEKVDKNKNDII